MKMVHFSHDYDKRDNFDFPIVNCSYLSSNILESPAYGVFVSQLIRYAWVCSKYEDFLFRGSILASKLLQQGYSSRTIQATFRKFYGRHTDLVHKFNTSVSHMLKGLFTNCDIRFQIFGVNRHRCHMLTLSGTHDFTPFGELMISPIHYIYIILLNLSVFGLFVRINDSGLFAWISLTALSQTYFMTTLFGNPCMQLFMFSFNFL